jgi:hypothetical protein
MQHDIIADIQKHSFFNELKAIAASGDIVISEFVTDDDASELRLTMSPEPSEETLNIMHALAHKFGWTIWVAVPGERTAVPTGRPLPATSPEATKK